MIIEYIKYNGSTEKVADLEFFYPLWIIEHTVYCLSIIKVKKIFQQYTESVLQYSDRPLAV